MSDQLKPLLEAMTLPPRCILLLRGDLHFIDAKQWQQAIQYLAERMGDDAPLGFITLGEGDSLETLSEDDMRAAGWVRIDSIADCGL